MNNILLTVIGSALAASATTMSVSYGGDALRSGSDRVVAASALSTAAQIASAVQLYDLQEGEAYDGPSLSGLVDADYLKAVPENPAKGGAPVIGTDEDGERIAAIPLGSSASGVCEAARRIVSDARGGCMIGSDGASSAYVRI